VPDAAESGFSRTDWSPAGDPLNTLRPLASVRVPPEAFGDPLRAGAVSVSVTVSPIFTSSFRHPARYSWFGVDASIAQFVTLPDASATSMK
jgi:hypothetical protein